MIHTIGKIKGILVLLLLFCLLFGACERTPIKGKGSSKQISRQWLTFQYEQRILPYAQAYAVATKQLAEAAQTYEKAYGVEDDNAFKQFREAFAQAFLCLQDIIIYDRAIFDYGKTELYEMAGTTDPNKANIKDILRTDLSFSDIQKKVERKIYLPNNVGYAAMDYLLFSGEVAQDSNVRQYLSIIARLQQYYAHCFLQHWQKEKVAFLQQNDFSATGSISQICNGFIQYYEKNIRTRKLGMPLGIYGLSLIPKSISPSSVEAYYYGSQLSNLLLRRAVEQVSCFYFGWPNGQVTIQEQSQLGKYGFRAVCKEYISSAKKIEIIDNLDESIRQALIATKMMNLGLSELVKTPEGNDSLRKAYDSLQRIVGLVKAKAIPALGLTVTYTDGEEGD